MTQSRRNSNPAQDSKSEPTTSQTTLKKPAASSPVLSSTARMLGSLNISTATLKQQSINPDKKSTVETQIIKNSITSSATTQLPNPQSEKEQPTSKPRTAKR